MPKFAANLTMLFNEVAFLDRFERAAKAGFKAVEFLFPYPFPAAELRSRLQGNGLALVLHNLPAGDWDKGERGIACLPERTAEFREGVAKAAEYATALGVKQVNCLAGKTPQLAGKTPQLAGKSPQVAGKPPQDETAARDTFVANLRFAAAELKKSGVRLLIEPINTFDIPGFHLQHTSQALEIMDEVGSDNLFLQYDAYHMQRMEGELAATLQKHLPRIAHVQVADNPGRNEPGTGEINHDFLFAHLDRIGYGGWIGCEYKPATNTEAGLGWLKGKLK
jgi:hydroxypyruvate isomerase